jgi:hypothetical protein
MRYPVDGYMPLQDAPTPRLMARVERAVGVFERLAVGPGPARVVAAAAEGEGEGAGQGLTRFHFTAQPEPFLTHNTP